MYLSMKWTYGICITNAAKIKRKIPKRAGMTIMHREPQNPFVALASLLR